MQINTVTGNVDNSDKYAVDLEQALSIVGIGFYNVKYCIVLAVFLIGAITDAIGYSYVLPAAKCDLNMTDSQRGLIASLPYIAIVVTSFPWGYLVDTQGRKRVIMYSSLTAGAFGILAAFMPDLISFTICKFLGALCIACPSACPYTYIGEILPQQHRDLALTVTNAMQTLGSALVPLLAWAILPLDFRVDFGAYDFRPWRVLTLMYSSIFIIGVILISFGPESPKYLISKGEHDKAILVLQTIYAGNKGKSPEDYPVYKLKMSDEYEKDKMSFLSSIKAQSLPLLKPPYLKWLALNGFLLFGVFSILNGLFMWVPDVLNRVLSGSSSGMTACQVISQRLNDTSVEDAECIDSIDNKTFVINSVANVSCALIALAGSFSLKIIGKKTLLVFNYLILGVFCVLINFITQDILFSVLLSSLQITALSMGPVNAYSVEIFPTHLRGMAVGLTLMMGRTGSVIGTNVAGLLINASCETTFYLFGGLLLLCSLLSLLLPRSNASKLITKGNHYSSSNKSTIN